MIETIVTEQMMDEVAAEHRKGRRLYVGTTNLDNGVATVWDMGRIASSTEPNRVQLYRDIAGNAIGRIAGAHYHARAGAGQIAAEVLL
jgi:hypothetical protein